MPLDPVLAENTSAWFLKAGNDLRAAGVDLLAKPPLLDDALRSRLPHELFPG